MGSCGWKLPPTADAAVLGCWDSVEALAEHSASMMGKKEGVSSRAGCPRAHAWPAGQVGALQVYLGRGRIACGPSKGSAEAM